MASKPPKACILETWLLECNIMSDLLCGLSSNGLPPIPTPTHRPHASPIPCTLRLNKIPICKPFNLSKIWVQCATLLWHL